MNNINELNNENIGKLLWKYSVPAITGMFVNALYNIVDRIFIGQAIGAIAISGISVAFPILIIIMAFGMLVGIGSGSLISIRLGERRQAEAEHILGNAFSLLIIISLTSSVLGLLFMNSILSSFGIGADTMNYAQQYLGIILLGSVFQNIGFGLNNIIRAEGNASIAMKSMLIGALLNFILDPIFIFVLHLGVKGTAIATVISQIAVTIWVLRHFTGKHSLLKLSRQTLSLNKNIIKGILAIGMSPFLMQLANSVINVLYNTNLVRYGSDLAAGAMGIIMSISMLFFMPIFGISQGVQPIIGFNYGAKNYDRVKKAQLLGMAVATLICLLGFIIMQFYPVLLISIFNNSDLELIRIGSQGLRLFLLMFPLIGFQIISITFFQATGKAKTAMILSLLRQVLILLPLLVILPRYWGLIGVWLSAPIADFFSALITGYYIWSELNKLKQKHDYSHEQA